MHDLPELWASKTDHRSSRTDALVRRSFSVMCPDASEVGQLYPFGRIITFQGNRYLFYFYRDDTHDENPADQTRERSIYLLPSTSRGGAAAEQ